MRWLCLVHLQARRRVWVHAPADSCLPRWLEGGSAVDPVSQGRRISHAPRIFPGQALARRDAWFQTASLGAAGITDCNCHRKFNLFLKETDRFYPQLRNVSSWGRDRRERDFLIFQGKALVN